jgi:tRNA-dihydrouridine synthase C
MNLSRPPQIRMVLAPMEGLVDPIIRDIYTQIGGVDWCVSEFVRVTDRLLPKKVFIKYIPEIHADWKTPSGTTVYPQLLGGRPEWLAENARLLADMGAPGIDLNFGCPAPTVNRHDGGAALLQKPERLYGVVSAVRTAVGARVPVSAKMRLGFNHKNDFLTLAKACEDGGASWLTVHARTKTDGYKPPAYWEYIARIREVLQIPVIANGEIWTPEDFQRCRQVTGCQDFMLGRGAIARPFLFQEIREFLDRIDVVAQLSTRLPSDTAPNQLALSTLTTTPSTKNATPLITMALTTPGTTTGFANIPLFPEQTPRSWENVYPKVFELIEKSIAQRGPEYACARVKQWLKLMSRTYPESAAAFDRIKRELKIEGIVNGLEYLHSVRATRNSQSGAQNPIAPANFESAP